MPSRLTEAREEAQLSQAALARLAATSREQIRRLESGERKLTKEWAERLAPYLRTDPESLLFDPHLIPVVGYVGAGWEAHYYGEAQGPFDHVSAPKGATDKTVAVEVRGTSLGEFYDGWLIFYDDVRSPVTDDLVGRLCVVGLADGRVLVKKVQRSRTDGYYHLAAPDGDKITDVVVDWAAAVKQMTPR